MSGDQKPQSQPQISYSDEYLESISSDKFLDEQKQSINQSAPQKSFVAFYRIRCSGCAADFAVMLESKFIEKYQNNNKIQVLGRAQTAKEAIRRACNKLTKRRKPHIGLSYEHNGWLLRGVGSRCK